MDRVDNGILSDVTYENFIRYFEINYVKDLSATITYEERLEFLKVATVKAQRHRYVYEKLHGEGAYTANLAKYGNLARTPLQIIQGDSNCTRLLMPKRAHTFWIMSSA